MGGIGASALDTSTKFDDHDDGCGRVTDTHKRPECWWQRQLVRIFVVTGTHTAQDLELRTGGCDHNEKIQCLLELGPKQRPLAQLWIIQHELQVGN